jgi:RNA polymerase sigma-70 factor, ECF subfamily
MDVSLLQEEQFLAARARAEPEGFAALYDHFFERVYNYIRYRVHDRTTSDDLTSQVFERALMNLRHYREERAAFGAWLFAIARNVVGDYYRAERRRKWLSLDFLKHRASDHPTPEQNAMDSERQSRLLHAVSKLDARERDLVALKFGAGITNREIARMTGLSESNVGVILHRALRKLKTDLTEDTEHERL